MDRGARPDGLEWFRPRGTPASGMGAPQAAPLGLCFCFQAEDGIRDLTVTGVQTCALPIYPGATTPVTLVSGLPSGGHDTRTLVIGPDNFMYVAAGSSCNVCVELAGDSMRAAVTRFNLDGSGGRIFVRGLRNSVGVAFHPTTGELWANNNDRDNLGDNVPPEHLNILKDGKWHGWPQGYLPGRAQTPDTRAASARPQP